MFLTRPSLSCALLLGLTLMTACGGGGSGGAGAPGGGGGLGGSPAFVAPLASGLPFDVDVARGGGFGHYANGERIVNGKDFADHFGIDIEVDVGTPVIASRSGTVVRASWHAGFGWLVIIFCDAAPGYSYVYTLYAHLDAIHSAVTRNGRVDQGQLLGWSGETGDWQDGPHLHFEFIHEPSALLNFAATGDQTGVSPNYDKWKDPALHVAGLEDFVGPGPLPAPPQPSGPGQFNMIQSSINHQAGTEIRDLYITWGESAGAASYQVVLFYFTQLGYNPGGTENLTTGYTEYSSILPASARRFDWSMDWSQEPSGTYFWKIIARNAQGSFLTRGALGTYFPN